MHGENWRRCLRRKAGSTKASALVLPGLLKKVAFKADKMLRKLFDPPAKEPDTWYGRLWCKVRSKTIHGFLPLLKTTSFIFDYAKDTFFFVYVFYKRGYVKRNFIKGLIIFNGATILTSGVFMGLTVQFDPAIVNFDTLANTNLACPPRLAIFIATPLVPVLVILQALSLTTRKRRLESEWIREQATICKFYLKHNKMTREKAKVAKALSNMKVVEVSTEGVPQLYILLVLLVAGSSDSCIGLIDSNDSRELTFFFSLCSANLRNDSHVNHRFNQHQDGRTFDSNKQDHSGVVNFLSVGCQAYNHAFHCNDSCPSGPKDKVPQYHQCCPPACAVNPDWLGT